MDASLKVLQEEVNTVNTWDREEAGEGLVRWVEGEKRGEALIIGSDHSQIRDLNI